MNRVGLMSFKVLWNFIVKKRKREQKWFLKKAQVEDKKISQELTQLKNIVSKQKAAGSVYYTPL